MQKPLNIKAAKIKILILRILAGLFLAFQLLGYAGELSDSGAADITDPAEKIGYYFGFNFALYIAVILFFWSRRIQKKIKRASHADSIHSIGQKEY